jgi:hypothetical protein
MGLHGLLPLFHQQVKPITQSVYYINHTICFELFCLSSDVEEKRSKSTAFYAKLLDDNGSIFQHIKLKILYMLRTEYVNTYFQ